MLDGCETVELAFAEELSTPWEPLSHVYFPTRGFISLIMPIDGPASLEVGLVGDEGMFGVPLALGIDISPVRAVVQGAGSALRMDAARFGDELRRSPALQRKMGHYAFVRYTQLAQTAACTRFHVVEARLARWLLMTQDRAHANTFHVTQEFLALMLGVRRVGVTKAATFPAAARPDPLQPRRYHGSRPAPAQGRFLRLLQGGSGIVRSGPRVGITIVSSASSKSAPQSPAPEGTEPCSPPTRRGPPRCPRCKSNLIRIPRRFIDRLFSLAWSVHRYRCRSFICNWEGNLLYDAQAPDLWDDEASPAPGRAPAGSVAPGAGASSGYGDKNLST